MYWVFVGFLCEKNKVGWIGRGRDLEKLWGGKEYDQIYLKVALNLKKKSPKEFYKHPGPIYNPVLLNYKLSRG